MARIRPDRPGRRPGRRDEGRIDNSGPGESGRAGAAIERAFPKDDGAAEQVLVQKKSGASDAQFRATINEVATKLESTEHVKDVTSPLDRGNHGQLSPDGRSALVTSRSGVTRTRPRRTSSLRWLWSPHSRSPTPSSASSSSAMPASTRRSRRPRARTSSGRDAVAADHAADPRDRLRCDRRGRHPRDPGHVGCRRHDGPRQHRLATSSR